MNPHTVVQRLRVDQAATITQRHPDTIRRALAAGELHGHQRTTKGTWSIRPECLEAWMDGVPCAHQEAGAA